MTLIFPVWVFNLHDSVVSTLGFILNIVVIATVLKRTSPAFRHYGHMVLAYAINDTIYSLVSMTCRRVIELKNGSLFHLGYGLEVKSPHWLALFIEFANEVVCMQASVIIPQQYYFRYVLISKTQEPTIRLLVGLMLFGFLNSVMFGLSDIVSNLKAATRGREHYIKQLDAHWKSENGTLDNFISANDIKDISTVVHFGIGTCLIFISYGIAMFYAFKTLRVVNLPLRTHALSKNTRNLTKQFTKNLFIQTIVTQVFAVCPSTYLFVYLVFKPKLSSAGPIVSSLFAWNPLADALITLTVVRPYRRYVLQLLGIRWFKRRIFTHTSITTALYGPKNSMATTSRRYSIESNRIGAVVVQSHTSEDQISPDFSKLSFARTDAV